MATALTVVPKPTALDALLSLVLDTVPSAETKRHYRHALLEFFEWREARALPFDRATVHNFRAELENCGYSASAINVRLAAIRKLAKEASINGHLDPAVENAIRQVANVRQAGNRAGNWLTHAEAQRLILSPDPATLKGKRDRCALALLVGCALRRSEAAQLTFEHIQRREGRWAIVDIIGKRNRIRTIAIPGWVKTAVDRWAEAAQISEGRVLRAVNQGRLTNDSLSGTAILDLVSHYGDKIGVALKAHDLRRTCAKLCRKEGGELEQIQIMLGHTSIQTTERYLGTNQNLVKAPNDLLGLEGEE